MLKHQSLALFACALLATAGFASPATASAQTKTVKFQLKPFSQTYKKINTMATRMVITMKGDMQADKVNAKVDGDMVFDLVLDNVKKQRAVIFGGEIFNQLLAQQSDVPAGMEIAGMGVYLIGKDNYVALDGTVSVCIKSNKQTIDTTSLEKAFTPDQMLGAFGSDSKAISIDGTLIGDKKVNGVETRHYKLDAKAINAVNQASAAKSATQYDSAEIWVAKKGEYLVKMTAKGNGDFGGLSNGQSSSFNGAFSVSYELMGVNSGQKVVLPKKCAKPIVQ
jgi:hypothetical protein